MFTVALIGGDGAGKTTVANYLVEVLPWRVKYLYMGQSTISSNAALPTTKIARILKKKLDRKPQEIKLEQSKLVEPTSNDLHYGYKNRNILWKFARFLNRVIETYWRQLITFYYRIQGVMVIYDRYILFDAAPKKSSNFKMKKMFDYLEYLIFNYLMPKPDLVIFLDAPSEVLYSRKGEASIKHLNSRRAATLKQGERIKNFVRVDASQPLEQVLEEVESLVNQFYQARTLTQGTISFPDERK